MKKTWTLLLAATPIAIMAQGARSAEVLYQPAQSAKDQGIALKGWGSGTISETDEMAFEGAHSIRVSTRNYFQGGIIEFAKGTDLAGKFEDKANLIKITFYQADNGTLSGSGRPGGGGGKGGEAGAGAAGAGAGAGAGGLGGRGGRGGAGGFPGGSGGAGGFPGGFPGGQGGAGFPGGRGGNGGTGGNGRGGAGGFPGGSGFPGGQGGIGGAAKAPAELKTVRLIVTTTDGKKSELYVPVDTSLSGEHGWRVVAVPLQAITGFDRTNKVVKSIGFAGDSTATIYVGDLRVVADTTPIRGEIEGNHTLNLAMGDTVTLTGSGTGGASILKYSWDFDDSDGIQEDATGRLVTRRFRKSGKFKVTLTITDSYGLKAPYTTTIDVTVNG